MTRGGRRRGCKAFRKAAGRWFARPAAAPVRVVAERVDAITLAYRVQLEPSFLEELRKRSVVAREHGRSAIEWRARVDKRSAARGFGAATLVAPRWAPSRGRSGGEASAEQADRALDDVTELRPEMVGELRYSRTAKVYDITHEPFFRLHIDLQAPGAVERLDDVTGERIEEAGWTVEIVWRAQTIAEWGVPKVLAHSRALVWQLGDVFEERLRRIDLCADVAGWDITPGDVDRVVKRPRAGKDVAHDPTEIDQLGRARRPKLGELAGPTSHETGSPGERKVCGISVGAGGALMCRIYNKRVELAYADEQRRGDEEERWRAGGWDGRSNVTRVEFQIRGPAVAELGIRDPDAARITVIACPSCGREDEDVSIARCQCGFVLRDERGKRTGKLLQRVAADGDGCTVGLVERLPWLWSTMLDWVRLVVPAAGKKVAATRLPDDPRWRVLRDVRFGEAKARPLPIKRYRARAAASEAQALGVCLSQAARDGDLREPWEEVPDAYVDKNNDKAAALLSQRLRALGLAQAARIERWLLDKYGGPVPALVHLAVRHNAARARFLPWRINAEHHHRRDQGTWPLPRDAPREEWPDEDADHAEGAPLF